jgi:hypothetical protein
LAVHPTCRLIEGDDCGVVAGDDREREALALTSGKLAWVTLGEVGEAGGGERGLGQFVADAVMNEVGARVLEQQRDATGRLDSAPRRREQLGGMA